MNTHSFREAFCRSLQKEMLPCVIVCPVNWELLYLGQVLKEVINKNEAANDPISNGYGIRKTLGKVF